MFPDDFSGAELAFQLFQQDRGKGIAAVRGARAPMGVPATSGGVSDGRIWFLFVASVPPNLIMMSDTEGRALPNASAADDIDAKAFTAFNPPALAVVSLAQQHFAGRGDETHVGSHGIIYRMLLMLSVRVP